MSNLNFKNKKLSLYFIKHKKLFENNSMNKINKKLNNELSCNRIKHIKNENKIRTFKEIDSYNYKSKLNLLKSKKYKKFRFVKDFTLKLNSLKEKIKPKLNKNIKDNSCNKYSLNQEILKKLLFNKFKKKYDSIIKIYNYDLLKISIKELEIFISNNQIFFNNLINNNILIQNKKISDDPITKNIINFILKLNIYIKDQIYQNFKFLNDYKKNIFDFKDVFYKFNEFYFNENKIINKYDYLKKCKVSIDDCIKNYKMKIKDLSIFKNLKYTLNYNLTELKDKLNDSNMKYNKKDNKHINEKRIFNFRIEKNKLNMNIQLNKINLKETKVEIKLEKINIKEKVLSDIFKKNIEEHGIFYYIKILRFIEEPVNFEEICFFNKKLDIDFLINTFIILDDINKIKEKKLKSNSYNNKKDDNKILGFEYSNKNEFKNWKNSLIKKFIFNNNKIHKKSSFLKINNNYELQINNLNNNFIKKIKELFEESTRINKNDEKNIFIKLLSIYFGVSQSHNIFNYFLKNNNEYFLNYTFFKKFIWI